MKNTRALGLKFIAFILVLMLSFTSFATFVVGQEEGKSQAGSATFSAQNFYFKDNGTDGGVIITGFVNTSIASNILVIPSMLDGKAVTAIADRAFERQDFLVHATIPASVKSIGIRAFAACSSLSSFNFLGDFDYIGDSAFDGTAWYGKQTLDFIFAGKMNKYLIGYNGTAKELVLPYTTEQIASYVFSGNDNIESVIIPERVTYIGEAAFYNCSNLADVIVRGSIEHIGKNAFEGTAWIASQVDDYVFFDDILLKYTGSEENVKIPSAFKRIAENAFGDSSLILSVQIPATVEVIGKDAFPKSVEIFCYKDSPAHLFAILNGYEIREFLRIKGDYNGDGKISAVDARGFLRVSANIETISAGEVHFYKAGDINGDGVISAIDARIILRISAKLESYDFEDITSMPDTVFDVLSGYAQALNYAAMREAGFSLLQYQEMKEYNLNANSVVYLREFDAELTSEKKAKVEKIAPGDAERLDSLYISTFLNSTLVEDASCTIKDGKYIYEIKLKDEVAEFGKESFTSTILPVAKKEDFQKTLESRWWYSILASDGVPTYNINYTNCSVTAAVDIDTGRLESIDMHMEYNITDIAGKLGGITIKDGDGNTNGSAVRIDTVKYDDFIFVLPTQ